MIKEKRFQKRVENFTCQHCGAHIGGTGFTNHCPECLWSKHVDKNPGDRKERCKGMMKPIATEPTPKGYKIFHRCVDCGIERSVRSAPEDNFEVILNLSTKTRREKHKSTGG